MRNGIVIVICIVVALISFLGGVLYEYGNYQSVIGQLQAEYDILQSKYDEFYQMPVDINTAYKWLGDMVAYHQLHIDKGILTEILPLELHQGYIDLYGKINELFLEFEAEYCK